MHGSRTLLTGLLLLPGVTYAAHPLISEDAGTQGRGNFQLELTTEHIGTRQHGNLQSQTVLTTATTSFGLLDNLDAILTLPHLRLSQSAQDGTSSRHGLTDTGLDFKWRFLESGSVSLAVKPGVTFPTGDEQRNLGTGRHTWSVYQVTSVELAPWSFHLHLGHLHRNNTFNERRDIWHASFSVIARASAGLQVVFDTGIDTNTDRTSSSDPVFLIAGLIWSPRSDIDIDVGYKVERADNGRSRALLAGLTARW